VPTQEATGPLHGARSKLTESDVTADSCCGRFARRRGPALLARIPNPAHALQQAPSAKSFDAFGLRVTYDKAARRIEISATITDAIAETPHNPEDLPEEVSTVSEDIAGARFVSRSDARIEQQYRP
jgi:hypothetical protein